MKNKLLIIFLLAAAFFISGCNTIELKPTNYLSHNLELKKHDDIELVWIKPGLDLAKYKTAIVERFKIGKVDYGDAIDTALLSEQLQNEIISELAYRKIFKKFKNKRTEQICKTPCLLIEGKLIRLIPGISYIRATSNLKAVIPYIHIEAKIKDFKTKEILIEVCVDDISHQPLKEGQDHFTGILSEFAKDLADLLENEKRK